jgi:hypothetical protein
VLLSAGIGATPVLAMLYAMQSARATRPVLWLHVARDGKHFPFAGEIRRLISDLAQGHSYVCFSRPEAADRLGTDFDATGRLSRALFDKVGITPDAVVYLCGPSRFMADMRAALAELGFKPDRIHIEIFNGGESSTPGITGAVTKTPHRPPVDLETGPLVSFARSGIAAHWNPRRAMSRCAGHAGLVSATTAKAVSFRERSRTSLSPSTSRRQAISSSAVRVRSATSLSICNGQVSCRSPSRRRERQPPVIASTAQCLGRSLVNLQGAGSESVGAGYAAPSGRGAIRVKVRRAKGRGFLRWRHQRPIGRSGQFRAPIRKRSLLVAAPVRY